MKSSIKLKVSKDILLLIRKMHPDLKKRVRLALDEILLNPDAGKLLKHDLNGMRSYRVGRFRVIYKITRVIEVVAIGPRKSIYADTLSLLKLEKISAC